MFGRAAAGLRHSRAPELLTEFFPSRSDVAFHRADDADLERRRFRSERAHFQALTEDSAEDSRQPGTFATFTCGNAWEKN